MSNMKHNVSQKALEELEGEKETLQSGSKDDKHQVQMQEIRTEALVELQLLFCLVFVFLLRQVVTRLIFSITFTLLAKRDFAPTCMFVLL